MNEKFEDLTFFRISSLDVSKSKYNPKLNHSEHNYHRRHLHTNTNWKQKFVCTKELYTTLQSFSWKASGSRSKRQSFPTGQRTGPICIFPHRTPIWTNWKMHSFYTQHGVNCRSELFSCLSVHREIKRL